MLLVSVLATIPAWPAHAETWSAKVRDSYFTPDFRVVVTGDTVVWSVEGSAGHTITSFPGSRTSFDSSPSTIDTCEPPDDDGGLLGGGTAPPSDCLQQGATFPQTFTRPGTVDYYCKVHGNPSVAPDPALSVGAQPCGMCGRILVKIPSSERPATRHPTPDPETSETEEPDASPSATATAGATTSPQPAGSLVAGPSTGDGGGSGGLRALFATGAIALLIGLGALVWRRYFVAPG